jgi:curli biogenesis system outer membrane secretion channel CsgG
MNNKIVSVLIMSGLLISCARVDSPSSVAAASPERVAPVEQFNLANYHGAKLSVKVYPWRITDVDLAKFPILNNYHIGWGVSNRLTDILFDVDRFKFYEEKQEIAASQLCSSCKNNQQAEHVDYIIYPEVYHLGIEKNTNINGFDTANSQSIEIGIQIKLVDAKTGEIKAAGSYIGQKVLTNEGDIINNPTIDFSESALGKATDAAIKGAVAKMLTRFDRKGGADTVATQAQDTTVKVNKEVADDKYRTFNVSTHSTLTKTLSPSDLKSQKRLALVIGNAQYQLEGVSLANATHDAEDISKMLTQLGFDVSYYTNQNKRDMEQAIQAFGQKVKASGNGTAALFYYAGHASEIEGINYMFPVDVQLKGESLVGTEAVPVNSVVKQIKMTGNDLNILVLDACRDNPYAPDKRSFNTQYNRLATMEGPKGTIISYSTASGKQASDGDGRNGLYTGMLLKNIPSPGLKIEELFKIVRLAVSEKSGNDQIAWENSSLISDFYFIPPQ